MKLEAVDYQASDAAVKFATSLRETGFGVLTNHPILQSKVSEIYAAAEVFFNSETKHDFLYDKETQDGFFPQSVSEVAKGHTVKDIKEYYHFYPWGRCPEELRPLLASYYEQANTLAAELLGWIQDNAPEDVNKGFNEPLSNMINGSDRSLLRVLHYPAFLGDEQPNAIRAAAHEDINLITILPAANEPGLQVKDKDGGWLDVPCDFGNLIVNIGDMLQEASNGYYPSTTHRVINPAGTNMKKARVSLPLFLHPRADVVLSERHTAGSYLEERLKELGVI
ncbi:isopenicillin N synthase family oxygenase [Alteromonas sp. 5E99-2]|uniref:isopenicillin N synthase family oxygenase n=1 Tax=Alteromonas sp. 5E99-2 TaxID=2817683 RepID=UPI001A98C328|nr:isopenicillin N synthase family oxygenase [Alteromonas sp. 5E99-2]MBO1254552.1 isopenicillin N synthase family oxygenase [Alteromonas sp. 5E99-2]